MKRFIYILMKSLAMAMILLCIPSCMEDDCAECNMANKDLTIELSFTKSSNQNEQTRATEPSNADGSFNEQKIETLNAFFYQGNTLKWKVSSSDLYYDEGTNIATLAIPTDKQVLFNGNTTITYDFYVVANNKADLSTITEGSDNLEMLKNLVFQSPEFVSKGGGTPQTSFVMDGSISKVININDPDLGTIDLKRAASKIRLRVTDVNVPNYVQDGDIQARLIHFTDKSALLQGGVVQTPSGSDWKSTASKTVSTTASVGLGLTTAAPFYSYANNWQQDVNRETYIELYVPLKQVGGEETYSYKYYVPVTPQNLTGDEVQYMNRLDRNYIYDIGVVVKILGSIEEPPMQIDGNYTIKDWSTQEVLVDIKGAHYLVVSERNVVMPNTTNYTLTFNSSIANVTLVPNSLKATYTFVPAGASAPTTVNVVTAQSPSVTVQPNVAAGTITISSPIPVNYIPKDIEFKVTNGSFIETVTVRQLPPTYFTTTKGIKSSMRNSLPTGLKNPYMYGITTLAPEGNIIWGFPPTDSQGQTLNNEEASKMVSPKFEMASQFGASSPISYTAAQTQCRNYSETQEGGTVKNGWRLPTAAEIHFINNLQQAAPSGYVMTGLYYWSNWSQLPTLGTSNQLTTGAFKMGVVKATNQSLFYYYKYMLDYRRPQDNTNENSGGSTTSAYTRCIRDIKD